jgi:ATP-dependent protease ClpP protease subunit
MQLIQVPNPARVFFAGDIGEAFLQYLDQCNHTLILNTPGGDASAMCAAIDSMRLRPLPLIVATGLCMSAGVPIFAMAKQRACTRMTRFMVHRVKSMGYSVSTADDAEQEARELRLYEKYYLATIVQRTKKDAKFWAEKIEGDWYFSAREAVEVGLVDEIL